MAVWASLNGKKAATNSVFKKKSNRAMFPHWRTSYSFNNLNVQKTRRPAAGVFVSGMLSHLCSM